MYDLDQGRITQGSVTEPIESIDGVYMTPFGWFEKWEDAAEKCRSCDLDPMLVVRPVARLKSKTMHEVIQ